MIIEAMKMEHTISAPNCGTVGQIDFSNGLQNEPGSVPTEAFSQRNTYCTVAEAFERFEPAVCRTALDDGVRVRGDHYFDFHLSLKPHSRERATAVAARHCAGPPNGRPPRRLMLQCQLILTENGL